MAASGAGSVRAVLWQSVPPSMEIQPAAQRNHRIDLCRALVAGPRHFLPHRVSCAMLSLFVRNPRERHNAVPDNDLRFKVVRTNGHNEVVAGVRRAF
jgi:hypothetical protein